MKRSILGLLSAVMVSTLVILSSSAPVAAKANKTPRPSAATQSCNGCEYEGKCNGLYAKVCIKNATDGSYMICDKDKKVGWAWDHGKDILACPLLRFFQ